jgi:hypothetical protein
LQAPEKLLSTSASKLAGVETCAAKEPPIPGGSESGHACSCASLVASARLSEACLAVELTMFSGEEDDEDRYSKKQSLADFI